MPHCNTPAHAQIKIESVLDATRNTEAMMKIAGQWRMRMARKARADRVLSRWARKIQSTWVTYCHVKAYRQMKAEVAAATRVQAAWRGYRERKAYRRAMAGFYEVRADCRTQAQEIRDQQLEGLCAIQTQFFMAEQELKVSSDTTPPDSDVIERPYTAGGGGGYPPPLDHPPPPPPLPMFEADSQNFASAPSVPRGFKLQNAGSMGGPWEEGGPSQPPAPFRPSPSPLLLHPCPPTPPLHAPKGPQVPPHNPP